MVFHLWTASITQKHRLFLKKKIGRERRKEEYSNVLDKVSEATQGGNLANTTGVAGQFRF